MESPNQSAAPFESHGPAKPTTGVLPKGLDDSGRPSTVSNTNDELRRKKNNTLIMVQEIAKFGKVRTSDTHLRADVRLLGQSFIQIFGLDEPGEINLFMLKSSLFRDQRSTIMIPSQPVSCWRRP